jgi:hypothetical protein
MVTSVVYGRIGWRLSSAPSEGKTRTMSSVRIRNRAFSLVENITQGDLEEQSTPDPGPSPQPLSPQEAKYRELAQNKLAHLRNARLLATDPSMMFKLDQEIAELEKLLG